MRINQSSDDELIFDDGREEFGSLPSARESSAGSSYAALAILLSVISLLFVISSILNTLFVVIYLRKSSLRNISNRFIVSLTVWNLLSCWIVLPIIVADAYLTESHLGGWGQSWPSLCIAFNVIVEFVIAGSIFGTILIALDRFLAITDPLHYHMLVTKNRSCFLIIASWCLAVFVGASSGAAYQLSGNWNVCAAHPSPENWHRPTSATLFSTLSFIIVFLIPLIALSWAYRRIYQAAQRNSERNRNSSVCVSALEGVEANKNVSRSSSTRSTSSQLVTTIKRRISNASLFLYKEEARAAKISAAVVVLFLLCWGPFYALQLVSAIIKEGSIPTISFKIVLLLALSNSALSPYIYVYRSRRIQKEVLKFCGFRIRPKRTSLPCPRRLTYHHLPPKIAKIQPEALSFEHQFCLQENSRFKPERVAIFSNIFRSESLKVENRRHSFVFSSSCSSSSGGCSSASTDDSQLPRLLDQVHG